MESFTWTIEDEKKIIMSFRIFANFFFVPIKFLYKNIHALISHFGSFFLHFFGWLTFSFFKVENIFLRIEISREFWPSPSHHLQGKRDFELRDDLKWRGKKSFVIRLCWWQKVHNFLTTNSHNTQVGEKTVKKIIFFSCWFHCKNHEINHEKFLY